MLQEYAMCCADASTEQEIIDGNKLLKNSSDLLDEALLKVPQNKTLWTNRFTVYQYEKNYQQMIKAVDSYTELLGYTPDFYMTKCLLLERVGEPEHIFMPCYRQVIDDFKAGPTHIHGLPIALNLALIEKFAGQEEETLEHFKLAEKELGEDLTAAVKTLLFSQNTFDRKTALETMFP